MAIEITEQEEQLILQLRRAEQEETRRRNSALKVLKTAYEFEAWMQQEGAGPTYSTFCEDFGYEAIEGEHRPSIYERVLEVIKLAKS